jgi:RIO kinase 1
MWALYEQGELKPDTQLTGRFELSQHEIDEEGLMQHLYEVEQEEMKARARRGEA